MGPIECPETSARNHYYKVNQSHYRPEMPRGFQEVKVPRLRDNDNVTTAQDGGKVVSFTHQPLFTLRKYSWFSLLLEAESTPWP